jgi:N-sulfoglucosamine sulfohydrolase
MGVGLLLREVEAAGAKDSTLTIFFSDNGIPFPSGKTNLGFEQGQAEPLLISSPLQKHRGLLRSSAVVSSLDLLPTILDWAGVEYPRSATAAGKPVTLSGASLASDSLRLPPVPQPLRLLPDALASDPHPSARAQPEL